jgi:hypothetical protein
MFSEGCLTIETFVKKKQLSTAKNYSPLAQTQNAATPLVCTYNATMARTCCPCLPVNAMHSNHST